MRILRTIATYFSLLLMAVVVFAASPQKTEAQLADSPWPTFHHDNRRTGDSPYTGTKRAFTKWKYGTNSSITASPVIDASGTIYIGSYDTYFYAIGRAGGMRWRFKTGNAIRSTAAIGFDAKGISLQGRLFRGHDSQNGSR